MLHKYVDVMFQVRQVIHGLMIVEPLLTIPLYLKVIDQIQVNAIILILPCSIILILLQDLHHAIYAQMKTLHRIVQAAVIVTNTICNIILTALATARLDIDHLLAYRHVNNVALKVVHGVNIMIVGIGGINFY